MRLIGFRERSLLPHGLGRLPIAALGAALILCASQAHAQSQESTPSCIEGHTSASCRPQRPVPGLRMAIAGATLFSLGYTLPVIVGGAGAVWCASGRGLDCPLMLSFLPIVGMPIGVAWRAAATPAPPPGTFPNEGDTYLFIGAATFSAVQVIGGILAIAGIVRERRAILHGARIETQRWVLLPGPSAIGLSLAIVSP